MTARDWLVIYWAVVAVALMGWVGVLSLHLRHRLERQS
jgi:hypothetical protein